MFRLSSIQFSFGSAKIKLSNITVLVGPNNSGKSTTLRNIDEWFNSAVSSQTRLINNIDVSISDDPSDYVKFEKDILEFEDGDRIQNKDRVLVPLSKVRIFDLGTYEQGWYNIEEIKQEFNIKNIQYFRNHFFRYFIVRLIGKTRFELTQDDYYGKVLTSKRSINYLSRLFDDKQMQRQIGNFVYENFKWFPYLYQDIEKTDTKIQIRASRSPILETKKLTLKENYSLGSNILLSELGDGIRCFVGICLTVSSYPFRIILIDEPEAFLHPPTSRNLGRWLSKIVEEKGLSLVVATHSPDFLIGCLEASTGVTIIRLTYDHNISTATHLNGHALAELISEPLLRSAESLSSLFHNSAVVTEDEKDKVFYGEINRKLLGQGKGLSDTIFLNAHGKYQIHKLIKPLRKTGLPVACIYDLDVIRTSDDNDKKQVKKMWEDIYSSTNINSIVKVGLENMRERIEQDIENQCVDTKKFQRKLINKDLEKDISNFLQSVKAYGIFIVPIGELENWTNIPKKKNWLKDGLNWIKTSPITKQGVWGFVDEITEWCNNPNRLGI